jgi:hypothetical protein
MIKVLKKLGIGGMYFNIIKAIYDKSIANIVTKRGKLKTFPLESGSGQHLLITYFKSAIATSPYYI